MKNKKIKTVRANTPQGESLYLYHGGSFMSNRLYNTMDRIKEASRSFRVEQNDSFLKSEVARVSRTYKDVEIIEILVDEKGRITEVQND